MLKGCLDSSEGIFKLLTQSLESSVKGNISANKKTFYLSEMLDKVKNIMGAAITNKGLEASFTLVKDKQITINETYFEKILINLISNAVKYTPSGSIKTVIDIIGADINNSGESAENVIITVEDTGLGIAKEHIEKIFENFYSINSPSEYKAFEGLGMGLHLVKNMAEAMSGRIEVNSEFGKGSIFKVTLPVSC